MSWLCDGEYCTCIGPQCEGEAEDGIDYTALARKVAAGLDARLRLALRGRRVRLARRGRTRPLSEEERGMVDMGLFSEDSARIASDLAESLQNPDALDAEAPLDGGGDMDPVDALELENDAAEGADQADEDAGGLDEDRCPECGFPSYDEGEPCPHCESVADEAGEDDEGGLAPQDDERMPGLPTEEELATGQTSLSPEEQAEALRLFRSWRDREAPPEPDRQLAHRRGDGSFVLGL